MNILNYKKFTLDLLKKHSNLAEKLQNSSNYKESKDFLDSLNVDMKKFISYSNYQISISEKIVIWLLGAMSMVSFFATREASFFSDIFALGFSMAIIFLLVQINDINKNNMDYTISDLILCQNILIHMDRDFYLPKHLIELNKIPWASGSDENLIIRYTDKKSIKTKKIEPTNGFQNKLAYILLILTVGIVSVLIYSNYSNFSSIMSIFS